MKELIFIDKKIFAADIGMKISNLNSPKESKTSAVKRENQRSAMDHSAKLHIKSK